MSLIQTIEVVCNHAETRVLRSVLDESNVDYKDKIILVDGKRAENLDMLVTKSSSIVVMSPVVGG